jgi:regulation of enolase protein 1 (concanavalin A-like superfamily)
LETEKKIIYTNMLLIRILFPSILAFCAINNCVVSQDISLGIFDGHGDVGNCEMKGSVLYNSTNQEYIIEAAGENMWFGKDEFHFLWKQLKGDFILRAQVEFIGEGVDAHRKLGWMIRENLESDSPHINACVHGDGLTSLQFRKTTGGDTEEIQSEMLAPEIIQLERKGKTYIMSTAHFGKRNFDTVVSEMELGNEVYVGLYVCSHNKEVKEKAIFRDVRITYPENRKYK